MSDAIQLAAVPPSSLVSAGWRACVAPVDRSNALPVPFDPASGGRFALDTPPTGWWSVGAVLDFRRSAESVVTPVLSGSPASVKTQVRSTLGETLEFTFPSWNRMSLALSGGSQTMNLLLPASGANANPSGGAAAPAENLLPGSTATVLQLASTTAVQVGDLVAVDVDYTGQTGFLGSAAAGAFLAVPSTVADVHFIRRVSFNVARVMSVVQGTVTLASSLPAGAPGAGMKVARLGGFVDRVGGAFLQEWSALFVLDGVQGDRLLLHYPRLQPAGAFTPQSHDAMAPGLDRCRPAARMRALPVIDANDATASVCFRSYLPAPMRLV